MPRSASPLNPPRVIPDQEDRLRLFDRRTPTENCLRMPAALMQWIWFIGATVWYGNAAIFLHYGSRTHALLSLIVASMFFIAGMVGVKTPRRR